MNPSQLECCDIRIAYVLAGCKHRWRDDVRYVQTSIPADAVAQLMRPMARAQARENVQAERFRAKQAFALS